ncbi:MAG: hypothetical protein H0X65_11205 [Gemmatimonadetes bacterium]|jgi:hypothetical protein|nr:hypothetical protein [Gemmatimonadota bacterium]
MPAARHLLTVWNPSYAASAMNAHFKVLLAGGGFNAGEWLACASERRS